MKPKYRTKLKGKKYIEFDMNKANQLEPNFIKPVNQTNKLSLPTSLGVQSPDKKTLKTLVFSSPFSASENPFQSREKKTR